MCIVSVPPRQIDAVWARSHHKKPPDHDGCGEGDDGEEGLCAPFEARFDTTPVLQPAKLDLDADAALVASSVVADGLSSRLPTGNARAYPLVPQGFLEPVGIATAFSNQLFYFGQTSQQGGGSGMSHCDGSEAE